MYRIGLLIVLATILGKVSFSQGIDFQNITFEEAIEQAKKQDKLIFIDFYTQWCGPCKELAKGPFLDASVGAFYNEHFINLKLDAEREGKQTAQRYEVNRYPTLLYINQEGRIIYNGRFSKTEKALIQEGEVAIHLASSDDNLIDLQAQFKKRQDDEQFLKSYYQKMIQYNMSPNDGIDAWLKVQTEMKEDSPEMMHFLLKNRRYFNVNGKAEEIIDSNYDRYIQSANEGEERALQFLKFTIANNTLKEARATQNPDLMKLYLSKYNNLPERVRKGANIKELHLEYLLMSKDYSAYKKEAIAHVDSIIQSVSLKEIRKKDKATYDIYVKKEKEESERLNRMKMGHLALLQVAKIEKIALQYLSVCENKNDYKTLDSWIDYCYKLVPDYQDIDHIKVKQLYRMGKIESAVKLQKELIDKFPENSKDRIKLEIELEKMLEE